MAAAKRTGPGGADKPRDADSKRPGSPSKRRSPPSGARKSPPGGARKSPPSGARKASPSGARKSPPSGARKATKRPASRRSTGPGKGPAPPSVRERRPSERAAPPPRRKAPKSRNLRFDVEYLGTRFAGWEEREGERTAGGELKKALEKVLGEPVMIISSDRPEPGVHAAGMTCNALTSSGRESSAILAALRRELPDDLGVVDLRDAADDFHARGQASAHVYRYHVATRPSVFLADRAWLVEAPIDRGALDTATKRLAGLRDLASFCPRGQPPRIPTRAKIFHAAWKESGDELVLRISISHAPPEALLGLTCALIGVGTGALEPQVLGRFLSSPRLGQCRRQAPPHGLVLDHVEHDAKQPAPKKADPRKPASKKRAPKPERPATESDEVAPTARAAIDALERGSGEPEGDDAASTGD